ARVCSRVTEECEELTFAVLHMGDHSLSAGVRKYGGKESYSKTVEELSHGFSRADVPALIRSLDNNFGGAVYSLKSLFRDEQRRVIDHILDSTLREAEASLRTVYEHHAPLMRFLSDVKFPRPKALSAAAEFVLNAALRWQFRNEFLDLAEVRALLAQARDENVPLDSEGLAYGMERKLNALMRQFHRRPNNLGLLRKILAFVELFSDIPFAVNLWEAENLYYEMSRGAYRDMVASGAAQQEWLNDFLELGRRLRIRVERAQEAELAIAS